MEFDPDKPEDPGWPCFDELNDEQYAALWERFDLSGPPDSEIRAFANACFRAGQAQGSDDRVVTITFRTDWEAPRRR